VRHFKLKFLRSLLTILTCFILTEPFCQNSCISGFVLDITTKKPLAGAKVDLLLKTVTDKNYEIVTTTTTNATGNFIFQNIKSQEYSLACFYKMPSDRSYLPKEVLDNLGRSEFDSNINVLSGKTYEQIFYLMVACPYDSTKDQDYCPICKKKDMVKPILWGLPVYDNDGKCIINGKDISEYYLGGCEPDMWCNPTKHCKRCCIDF
jgi:hypothetical protein